MNDKKQIKLLQRGDEKTLENIILTYTNYVGTIISNQLGGFSDKSTRNLHQMCSSACGKIAIL